jgi:hypothetical protein
VWKDVEVNELMMSQNASGVPLVWENLILECPFPDKNCIYNQYHEIIHYVTYPSARLENESAVVASSSSDISSYSIILIRPDPILEKNRIYYIDVTDSNVP